PPELGGIAGGLMWTEGDAPAKVAPAGTVVDRDSANLASGKLTARITGAGATDRLFVANGGSVSTSANQVLYAGQSIGTFTGGVSTNPLEVTWNSSATSAKIQAVLRQVAYSNVSENPGTQPRTL